MLQYGMQYKLILFRVSVHKAFCHYNGKRQIGWEGFSERVLKKIFSFEGDQVMGKFIISKQMFIIPSNTTTPFIYKKCGCVWRNYKDFFTCKKHNGKSSVKYKVYEIRAMRMMSYNNAYWKENYGQILEIRFLRKEKISIILNRRDFCRIHAISRRILLLKQNNICSVFLTKFWTRVNAVRKARV
jgi:hypothetical protein